jgi:signal transduction histidine kinase
MQKQLRVLLIEDSEDDAILLARHLIGSGYDIEYSRLSTAGEMRDSIAAGSWDVVIADYVMPQFDALAALQILKESGLDLPFIIVSGKIGEETAVAAMKAGAHDYIMKSNLTRLGAVIERELLEAKMRSDKRLAESKARELDALKEVDRLRTMFLSHVSHELRTPLATIKGFASTLLASDVTWSEQDRRDFLQTMSQEIDRLARFIDALMAVSRLESGMLKLNRGHCRVEDIINETRGDLISLAWHHKLELKIPAGLPVVFADCARIGQVLNNLVDNAAKYSPPGSSIVISATDADGCIIVCVTDKGAGISAESQKLLFEYFFREKTAAILEKAGMGLGLPICRGIVEAHGGKIWAESQLGKGSQFYFSIPLTADA